MFRALAIANCSDGGLTLETLALKLFTVTNLRYKLW